MNKLKLNLTKGNELVLDKELSYFLSDNKLNFSDEENLYKILINDKVFMKKNKESLIKIDFKNKITTIKLLDQNLEFEMKLLKSNYKNNENELIMEYILDDGENIINNIIIKY